jgi:Amidohydrolase
MRGQGLLLASPAKGTDNQRLNRDGNGGAMTTRRDFLDTAASAFSGLVFVGCGLMPAPGARAQPRRREVVVNGKRAKTVNIHAHCAVPAALTLMNLKLGGPLLRPDLDLDGDPLALRLKAMDEQGIDVEALSINPNWYKADRDVAAQVIKIQNEKLADVCAKHPDRFVAFATVALQYPDLAVEQLQAAVKSYGFRGVNMGGNVAGDEISDPKFHPFWAKVEELGVLVFIHPQGDGASAQLGQRFKGNGYLVNVIGNPLETTIALSQVPGTENLRRAWRRLFAILCRALRPWLFHAPRPVPRRRAWVDQEKAVGVSPAALLRRYGLHAGRRAPSDCGSRREPADDRDRLPVSLDQYRGGSHPADAGAKRCGENRDPRRDSGPAHGHKGVEQYSLEASDYLH